MTLKSLLPVIACLIVALGGVFILGRGVYASRYFSAGAAAATQNAPRFLLDGEIMKIDAARHSITLKTPDLLARSASVTRAMGGADALNYRILLDRRAVLVRGTFRAKDGVIGTFVPGVPAAVSSNLRELTPGMKIRAVGNYDASVGTRGAYVGKIIYEAAFAEAQ